MACRPRPRRGRRGATSLRTRRPAAPADSTRGRRRGGPRHLPLGVVRRAHQRPRLHVPEAHRAGAAGQRVELRRRHEARDGQVLERGAQVLPHRQDVAAHGAQVAQHGVDLVHRLAQPQHQAALRDRPRRPGVGASQQFQAALVARLVAHAAIEAGHRLGVVIEDLRRGPQDGLEGLPVAVEVGDQQLDRGARREPPDPAHGLDEEGGAAVGHVVAVDRRDHRVVEAHPLDGHRYPARLVGVEGAGAAAAHLAVAAGAGADLAEDEEGGRAAVPALADVGAARLLADGVQALVAHQPAQTLVGGAAGRARLEPSRLGSRRAATAGRGWGWRAAVHTAILPRVTPAGRDGRRAPLGWGHVPGDIGHGRRIPGGLRGAADRARRPGVRHAAGLR